MRLDYWEFVPHEVNKNKNVFPVILIGRVYGHSKFNNGSKLATAPVVMLDGIWAHTADGLTYELGMK